MIGLAAGSGVSSRSARWGRWALQGRPGARCRLSTSRFPGPPSEPGVPVIPAPGSPRGPLPATVVLAARLRRTRPGLPGRDAGVHRWLLPCRHAPGSLAVPFARCTPLACSDDDGHSATARRQQPTTRLPATQWPGRAATGRFHVHRPGSAGVGSGSGSGLLRPAPKNRTRPVSGHLGSSKPRGLAGDSRCRAVRAAAMVPACAVGV
jgi:hypothetical protein